MIWSQIYSFQSPYTGHLSDMDLCAFCAPPCMHTRHSSDMDLCIKDSLAISHRIIFKVKYNINIGWSNVHGTINYLNAHERISVHPWLKNTLNKLTLRAICPWQTWRGSVKSDYESQLRTPRSLLSRRREEKSKMAAESSNPDAAKKNEEKFRRMRGTKRRNFPGHASLVRGSVRFWFSFQIINNVMTVKTNISSLVPHTWHISHARAVAPQQFSTVG